MARPGQGMETDTVTFQDADGDSIGLRSESMGARGRVVMLQDGQPCAAIPYVRQLVYASGERKLYINGHEAVIPLPPTWKGGGEGASEDIADLLRRVEEVSRKGKVAYSSAETVDAAKELAKVQEDEADELQHQQGLTPEQIARLQSQQSKERSKKKRVTQETLDQMLAMGYAENRARRALALCNGTTAEVALQWLEQHQTDDDIDDPVPPEKEPEWVKPLTAEEKAQKVKDLEQVAKQKKKQRQEEEQKAQILREKKRREDGQNLREIKEEHERNARLKAYEEKRREKEADVRAKAELRAKMNADRIAKGWAPLPDPEEERKKKQAAAGGGDGAADDGGTAAAIEQLMAPASTAAADDDWDPWGGQGRGPAGAGAAAARGGGGYGGGGGAAAAVSRPALPLPAADGLPLPGKGLTEQIIREAIRRVEQQNGAADAKRCLSTLATYAKNAVSHPCEQKYRSISISSKGYESRVGCIEGGAEVLFLLGFRPRGAPPKELFLTSLHVPTVAETALILEKAAA